MTFTATVGSYTFTLTNRTSITIGTTSNTSFSQNLTASGSGSQSFTLTMSNNGQPVYKTTSVTVNSLPNATLSNTGSIAEITNPSP